MHVQPLIKFETCEHLKWVVKGTRSHHDTITWEGWHPYKNIPLHLVCAAGSLSSFMCTAAAFASTCISHHGLGYTWPASTNLQAGQASSYPQQWYTSLHHHFWFLTKQLLSDKNLWGSLEHIWIDSTIWALCQIHFSHCVISHPLRSSQLKLSTQWFSSSLIRHWAIGRIDMEIVIGDALDSELP